LQPSAPKEDVEFELAGRIAVRYREEAASGNVAWRHARGSDELLITSPVGSSVARLVRAGSEFVLTTADQREYRAADAEALTEQVLGFRLPLAGLADWVRGRVSFGPPAEITRDAQGRPAVIEQGGWRIEYQEFRSDGLPVRLKLAYPGIDLRLAIHEWKPAP
jgi:outer membrane lipoprotein LolB